MDITNQNFLEFLPLILKSIDTADFVAFDFEFSGLNSCSDDRTHDYDTDESRY